MLDPEEGTVIKVMEKLKEANGKLEDSMANLMKSTLQFTNFYFIFQSVIFTSIMSSSTPIKCKLRWIPFALSLLASIFTFVAIVENMMTLLTYYKELDYNRGQLDRERKSLDNCGHGNSQQALGLTVKPSESRTLRRRYIIYSEALLLLLVFTGVMLYGCLQIDCHH